MRKKEIISLALVLGGLFSAGAAYPVTYKGDQFRDPFSDMEALAPVPDAAPEKVLAPSEFVLEGVIWVPERPRAIINGRRVIAGMEIDGAKVVEIRRKEVTILLNGREMILRTSAEES